MDNANHQEELDTALHEPDNGEQPDTASPDEAANHNEVEAPQHDPEIKTPSGRDLLRQLAEIGWTKRQIGEHPSINRSFSLIDNWSSGRSPIPAKHIHALVSLLESGQMPPTPQSPKTPATNGHKPNTNIPAISPTNQSNDPNSNPNPSSNPNSNPWMDLALAKMMEEKEDLDLRTDLLTKAIQAREDYLITTQPLTEVANNQP